VKLLVATRSPGKLREARALLEPHGVEVVSPLDLGLAETPEEALLELGETFEANARSKAEYFVARSGLPTVADDSGLEVFALGGEPGVRSRRWTGASGTDAEVDAANNAELLRRLAGAPESKRRARYRCVLAYAPRRGAPIRVFEGHCTGRILDTPRGTGGFGYDPLFFSDDLGMSFAEAPAPEKNRVSHRGRAYRLLLEALREEQT
jgi:XTP/dITP diphosphohydrolase